MHFSDLGLGLLNRGDWRKLSFALEQAFLG